MIFCGRFLWNNQSKRVQDKCGFQHYSYGTFQTRYNTVEEEEINILTREQWLKKTKTVEIFGKNYKEESNE